jgi:hypothetical protein
METQNTQSSQNSLEKENKAGEMSTYNFRLYYKALDQNYMILS